jgi:hypothetical protein
MSTRDRRPLQNTPGAHLIAQHADNRLGAVYSALEAFWRSRAAALPVGASNVRRDAYSILLFNEAVTRCLVNDFSSSPDQLLAAIVPNRASGGTDFDVALKSSLQIMRECWNTERSAIPCHLSLSFILVIYPLISTVGPQ